MLPYEVFVWVVIPAFIFLSRILDVSLGTMRVIFISRGIKYAAPLLGFFEVLVWLIAIRQILLDLTNFYYYIVYAAGFAFGTLVGMAIEEKLSVGKVIIRIITKHNPAELITFLKAMGYEADSVRASGTAGKEHIIISVIKRHDSAKILGMLKKLSPKSFYSIEDVRYSDMGKVPVKRRFRRFGFYRKSK